MWWSYKTLDTKQNTKKSIEQSKFEQIQTKQLSSQREIIWNSISVVFRVWLCGLFLLWPRDTPRRRVSPSFFFFLSVQRSTCMCVSLVHVWRPLKCVNSDNAPYCPPRGRGDIAILCLRCREARQKRRKKKKTRRTPKNTEIVWKIPCREEVRIGMDTMLEPPGYNFILKGRFCCVQL